MQGASLFILQAAREVRAMEMASMDKLRQAAELINGLLDAMIYIKTAEQDRLISITILCPFEAVLEKASLLYKKIEEKGSRNNGK